jgi:hypothetical protein
MAYPTWQSIYTQVQGRLDSPYPASQVFSPSVFQVGLNEAYDVLYAAFLQAQAPRIEIIVYVTVPAGTTSLTAAQMGISDFSDFIYLSERPLGSQDRYIDLTPVDRLAQWPQTDRLRQFNYRNDTFYFVGATQNIDLQVKYDSSGVAPVSDGTAPSNGAIITVDSSQNFLANYTVSVIGPRKGYDEIAVDCRAIAVGRKFNDGVPGGQLFTLLSPLVRSRQNVQIAPKPYTVNRRLSTGWPAPYIAAQQGTTGGGVQNVPVQFTTANGTIVPNPNGVDQTFVLVTAVKSISVVAWNGQTLTPGFDYSVLGNSFTFLISTPNVGDVITAEVGPAYA